MEEEKGKEERKRGKEKKTGKEERKRRQEKRKGKEDRKRRQEKKTGKEERKRKAKQAVSKRVTGMQQAAIGKRTRSPYAAVYARSAAVAMGGGVSGTRESSTSSKRPRHSHKETQKRESMRE